jgi:hypothetical protein
VQVFNKWWALLIVYVLGITGTTFFVAELSTLVVVHAIELAQSHIKSSPPKLSLIQQRQLDTALALPPSTKQATVNIAPVDVPRVPPAIYAAQLDLAEMADSAIAPQVAAFMLEAEPSSIAPERIPTERQKVRVAKSDGPHSFLTTRDIFNRSFGVITAAAN